MTAHYLDRPRTRAEKIGAAFAHDERYERLLALPRAEREAIFDQAPWRVGRE